MTHHCYYYYLEMIGKWLLGQSHKSIAEVAHSTSAGQS